MLHPCLRHFLLLLALLPEIQYVIALSIHHKQKSCKRISTYHLHRNALSAPYSLTSPSSSSSVISTTSLFAIDFFESLQDRLAGWKGKNKEIYEPKKETLTEQEELIQLLEGRPWRAKKIKQLPIKYYPWKETWRERFRVGIPDEQGRLIEDDETIYIYTLPEFRFKTDYTKVNELWNLPFMWTKIKVERLAWINKYFMTDCENMSVQEHIEMDNFFSEVDMPVRWGILRTKEMDVLNVISLNLVFWTDFNGIKPTDLGLRPDNTVRTCPVQFHNCISSSNDPHDTEHYARPFKWSRSKSPDQAYDELKSVYANYPKRGLKWSSGWIDRGGWRPQEFSSEYFRAEADELIFQYTDDIELLMDVTKREVQIRSSARLGQSDCDTQRLRYNQFVRMLRLKGGWDVQPMPKLRWFGMTPFRWTQKFLDKVSINAEKALDYSVTAVGGLLHEGTQGGGNSIT